MRKIKVNGYWPDKATVRRAIHRHAAASLQPLASSLVLVLLAAPLSAQTTHPIDQVRENARSHIGPFYITPGLVLRDLGVDTNVFNEPDDPKSDFTFTLGPKADVFVPVAHTLLLQCPVGVDFVYYQKYSSERSMNPRFAPRATIFLNRLSFFGEGSYLRTRQRPNYEIDARSLRVEKWYGGGIGYQFSPKVGIEVSARRTDVEYDPEEIFLNVSLQQVLNRKSDTYTGTIKYAVTPLTTIVFKADTTQDRFIYSHERDADTLRILPGVEFNARALISGSAYLGVRHFNTKSDALEDFKGMVGSATLGYTLLGRTTFTFTAERDVTYSYERFQPYFLINSYGLTIRHRLAGKFDVMAGAARYQYKYRNLVDPALGAPATLLEGQRIDLTHNYSGSVGYYLGPDVRLGFGTTYFQRESNYSNRREYTGFRTGVSLNYGF
ncbi:MAG: outer membrane beta-barrel protein [Acidobacteriota bacterium]